MSGSYFTNPPPTARPPAQPLAKLSRLLLLGVFAFAVVVSTLSISAAAPPAGAQAQAAAEGTGTRIGEFWKRLYAEEGPETPPPSAPEGARAPDFPEYLDFDFGFSYTRNFVDFSGRPTRTLVVDDGPPLTVTPAGFSFPQSFEETDDQVRSYLAVGTRGFGDPRVNSYLSLIYQDDLDGTPAGSVFQSLLDSFGDSNRTEVINGYAEMNGFGTGALSHSSLRFGRQFVFDYKPDLLDTLVIDGVTVGYDDSALAFSLFSGRRVNYFGDPEADFSAGAKVSYQFQPGTSGTINYFYLDGDNRYAFGINHQIADVRTETFLTFINADPIELSLRAWYASASSPWTIQGRVIGKLTDEDFVFDIFREREPSRRPLLYRTRRTIELDLDVDYQVRPWLVLGGGVAARFVDGGEAAFDNSFQQVTVRLNWRPVERLDWLLQYSYRHVDRDPVSDVVRTTFLFDDITSAGETDYHQFNGEIYYQLVPQLSARVGGYFISFDSRNRLAEVDGANTGGGYLQGRIHLTRIADLVLGYTIDSGNREFNPDIDLQHTLTVGFDIHF